MRRGRWPAVPPVRLLQLAALCSLPALLALLFASPNAEMTWGNARLLVGWGSALGLGLGLAGLAGLWAQGRQVRRSAGDAAGLLYAAGATLLALPLLFASFVGLSALWDDFLVAGVVFASPAALYLALLLWLGTSLELLRRGRRVEA